MDPATLTGIAAALWLGVLTSISPCPLATNIAAMSFIARGLDKRRTVLLTGLCYTLGRMLAYLGLAALLVGSLLAAPQVSAFLQKYMSKLLGPILIVTGLVLLDWLRLPGGGGGAATSRWAERAARNGIWGGGLLGLLFALTFCPVSAALFFGSLIPLAVREESRVLLPLLYGAGTALPVLVFAILISVGVAAVGRAFQRVSQFEFWARRATGALFILLGIYFAFVHIYGISR